MATLAWHEGSPGFHADVVAAHNAALLGWIGLVIAMTMFPAPGVAAGDPGTQVEWVLPGSFALHDGIRETQVVVKLRRGESAESWELFTAEGDKEWSSPTAAHVAHLRGLVPSALVAAILGLVALALTWVRRGWGLPLAAAVAVIGTLAFLRLGDIPLSTIGALAALGIPALGAALLIRRRWRRSTAWRDPPARGARRS